MPTPLDKAVLGAALLETPGDALMHPEWVHGKRLWIEPAVKDICDRIQDGCPCGCGWEGDPRMAVYFDGEQSRWYVMRCSPDPDTGEEEYFPVTRSPVNGVLDHRVIDILVAHDTRRGFSVKDHIIRSETELERRADAEFDDLAEHVGDVLAFAFKRNTNDPSKAPKRHIV